MTSDAAGSSGADRIALRQEETIEDLDRVRGIVERAGVFSTAEAAVAIELLEERLARGEASGYRFLFAELLDRLVGYCCYGPIPATAGSYDLYWIVVDPSCQNRGVGGDLLAETERLIASEGGRRIYAETSGRDDYRRSRAFYERHGFRREAVLPDFYAAGDDKVIYVKLLARFIPA
jgi:ribosomal protein S18 acetylase RimI-like enzyme